MFEYKEVKLKLVRVTECPETVERYIKGHEELLRNNGIELSGDYHYWSELESVSLLVVENMDESVCFGGARIHEWDKVNLLPIQSFLQSLDSNVNNVINTLGNNGGVLEIAGLWNSRQVAGWGLGSEHLIRTSIASTIYFDCKSVITFCSPFVSRFAEDFGFEPLKQVGNEGSFPFPDERWISTVNFLEDKLNLPLAKNEEREHIKLLREKRLFYREYNARGRKLIIHFEL
jgi:hypothetical protein